jgi:hypothetical protein
VRTICYSGSPCTFQPYGWFGVSEIDVLPPYLCLFGLDWKRRPPHVGVKTKAPSRNGRGLFNFRQPQCTVDGGDSVNGGVAESRPYRTTVDRQNTHGGAEQYPRAFIRMMIAPKVGASDSHLLRDWVCLRGRLMPDAQRQSSAVWVRQP